MDEFDDLTGWDYSGMSAQAEQVLNAMRRLQSERPGVVNVPEALAVFERLAVGERVPVRQIGQAYTMLKIALDTAKAVAAMRGRQH